MPQSLPHPCAHPGCPGLTRQRYCDKHKTEGSKVDIQTRGTAAHRGYDARWRRIRAEVLRKHPLCMDCLEQGRTAAATDVHHIDGNVQNMAESNLRPLCKACHSRHTIKENRR